MLQIFHWLASFGTWIAKLITGDRETVIDGNAQVRGGLKQVIDEQRILYDLLRKQLAEAEGIIDELRKSKDADKESIFALRLELQQIKFDRDKEFARRIDAEQKQQSG